MHNIKLSLDIQPLSEFRANTAALIQQVKKTKRPLIITQHGKSSAVLLDVEQYEDLINKIEMSQEIISGLSDAANGNVISHEDFKKELAEYINKKIESKASHVNAA